jgi:hypothetical protein
MATSIADEQNAELQLVEEAGPDMTRLVGLYNDTLHDLNDHIEQQNTNYEIRHCIWPGQSNDQRKHARGGDGTEPFPWDGASDLKIPVVDEIINHGVALDCMALAKANIRAVAVESNDLAKAAVISNFMRWLVLSQMTELPAEAEILANYRRERGIAVLGVFWERRVQKTQKLVSLEEVRAGFPDVAAAIEQGVFTDELVKMMSDGLGISAKKARAMIRELRETGTTTVPHTVQSVNRPVVKAYAVGDEIIFQPNTADFQATPFIGINMYLTPEQAREKCISEGWDKDYVEYAIEHCLDAKAESSTAEVNSSTRYQAERIGLNDFNIAKGRIHFVKSYRRLSDEDGVPGIYCTVFCPTCHTGDSMELDQDYAKHELVGYLHGQYPFIPFPRERLSRLLLDTRGEPEVGGGWQYAIKTEIDARRDNASLSTCPPITHPVGREPGRIGPGAKVAERRPGEYGYMQIPPPPTASVEIQERIESMTRRYFGRSTAEDVTGDWQVKQSQQVATWLNCWKQALTQIFSLYKQYGPDEQFFRVIGANSAEPQRFSKAEMDENVDFYLTYDALMTDPESWKAKLDALTTIAQQLDRSGTVDYSKLLQKAFEMVDPILAEDVLIPSDVAAKKEVTETQSDIAKLMAGVDLDVPQMGINAQLRLQTVQNWMQGPPDNPATDVQQKVMGDEQMKKRVERYIKQLQFQIDQQQNAQIGRIGTAPAGSTGQ